MLFIHTLNPLRNAFLRIFVFLKIMMSYIKICLLSFIVIASLYSCKNTSDKNDTRTVFRYNESAGISTLDPAFAKDQAQIWACNQLYNGLVQPDDSMRIKPCIAKSWTISEDGLRYTFILRKDVFFQDDALFPQGKGRRVVASDFVYSFNRILSEQNASPGVWIFNDVAKDSLCNGSF